MPTPPPFDQFIYHYSLDLNVLAVATTRIEGTWAAYCGTVPGNSHDREKWAVLQEGSKLPERIARAIFGHLKQFSAEVPYAG